MGFYILVICIFIFTYFMLKQENFGTDFLQIPAAVAIKKRNDGKKCNN